MTSKCFIELLSTFQVVAPSSSLPININLQPFKEKKNPTSPLYIYPLPKEGYHHIKRVVHSGLGLLPAGPQTSCVLNTGQSYTVWSQSIQIGDIVPQTFGPGKSFVVFKSDEITGSDHVDVTVQPADQEKYDSPIFSGSVALYNDQIVEAA